MIHNRKLAKAASDHAIGNQKKLLQSRQGSRYVVVANCRLGVGGNSQICTAANRFQMN
jgi:hypothetical protein